jgi:DNA-binding transcriptional regulator YhcF (GntR family)
MELSIPLSKKNEPLFRQVYMDLRKAILSGAFPAGGRRPSTRDLAEQLGVSRKVVLGCFRVMQSVFGSARRRASSLVGTAERRDGELKTLCKIQSRIKSKVAVERHARHTTNNHAAR